MDCNQLQRLLLPLAVLGAPASQPSSSHCFADVSLLQRAQRGAKVYIGKPTKDDDAEAPKPNGSNTSDDEVSKPNGSSSEALVRPVAGAVTTFSPYPDYDGSLSIVGEVDVRMTNVSIVLAWSLQGTEDVCNGTIREKAASLAQTHGNGTVLLQQHSCESAANACGLHIHEGKTCSNDADVGGHFYDKKMKEDPWANVMYVSDSGRSIGEASLEIGKDMSDIIGHAFVVHDQTGARVACGIITLSEESTAATVGLFLSALLVLLSVLHFD